jgi:hypothetical protein
MNKKRMYKEVAQYVFYTQCCICPPLHRRSKKLYKEFIKYFKPNNFSTEERWWCHVHVVEYEYKPELARSIALLLLAEMSSND